jgi:lipopolysaccharide export system permease protein
VSLITRYILRETFGAWLLVIVVLFLILMTNKFAEILGDAAGGRLPRDAVIAVFALTAMTYLTALTPIAHFIGVLIALARLSRDGEMAALAACGIGPIQLLAPVSTLTFALAATLSWLALVENPAATRRIEEIQYQAEQNAQLTGIEPGRFTSPDSGETVLYARDVVGEELIDVFWQGQQNGRVIAILAARGERKVSADTGEQAFVLYNGRRYEGVPGESDFSVLEFDDIRVPVRTEQKEERVEVIAAKPTIALLGSTNPYDRAELQWRLSMPLSVLVLALLAVPLSRSSPREGRYARIGIGSLIYIIYSSLQSIARVWVEREIVPDWIGMWWVHALLLGVALLLLVRESGMFVRVGPVAQPVAA